MWFDNPRSRSWLINYYQFFSDEIITLFFFFIKLNLLYITLNLENNNM
jgi:hypothetical protein